MATDNSGHVIINHPTLRPPVNLSIGLYSLHYSAKDGEGNIVNCTFLVQVASKPFLRCYNSNLAFTNDLVVQGTVYCTIAESGITFINKSTVISMLYYLKNYSNDVKMFKTQVKL